MEILLGLLVFGFGVWLWSRRGDGAHQKFREDMGYGEPVSELEPIFPEKKRKVLSNVEKKAAALDVLEDNDVAESLFEIVNTGWHVSITAAFNEIEPDEFPSDRLIAYGYSECRDKRDLYESTIADFEVRDSNCFVYDGKTFDFFILEQEAEDLSDAVYRLHVVVNSELVADFGVKRELNEASLMSDWIVVVSRIEKLILGDWVIELAGLLDLLRERSAWREENARTKKTAQEEKDLDGKIDLGDYEP